jgi:hypothetical protein
MATLAELEDALANADAAGDTEAATALADEIVRMQSTTARTNPVKKAPAKPPATLGDRAQALAGGVNAGLVSALTLPFDTGANVVDIGNAALGLGYLGADKLNRAFGGEGVDIPAFIGPLDRSKYLGTQQNTEALLNRIGAGTLPNRPDDAVSKGLNIAGRLGGGILSGGIYNKLGIPSGITPRPGAPPPNAAPPGTPVGGPRGAVPPPTVAPPGGPLGGAPRATPPAPAPAGAPGGTALPAPIGLNATERATLAAGERLGLQVTPGARTGSPQLRQIEARLESLPATSGPFEAVKAANGRVVAREFLRAIGEQGDEVSAAALNRASDRIGTAFDDAAANTRVVYDNDLQNALSQVGARAASELTEAELPIIQRQLNEVLNRAASSGGAIEGPAFQNIFSTVGRLQRNGTGVVRDIAGDIRDALQDALVRSAGPRVANNLRNARDQYRVLRTAEKSGAIDVGSGSIRAGQLASAFRRTDNAGYQRGLNDTGLYDALRFSATRSFGPIVGNSGTATRLGGFPDTFYRAGVNAAGNLAARAYLNTPAPILNAGVQAGNATQEIVRQMLNIPRYQTPGTIVGLDAAEDELRRGLSQ